MKQYITFFVAIFFVFSLAGNKVITHPDYDNNGGSFTISIEEIELTDSVAIFDITCYGSPDTPVRLNPETFLKGINTGNKYLLKGRENNDLAKWTNIPDSGYLEARIYFDAIDPIDSVVDFIEPGGWYIQGLKMYEDNLHKIKTNISGNVEIPSTSWLLIEEVGNDDRVNKSYVVPVRDGRFSYDLYTDFPQFFTIARGEEILKGSWRLATFWSEGKDVNINFSRGKGEKTKIEVNGGTLTDSMSAFRDRLQKSIDDFYNANPAYREYYRMEEDGSLYTEEAKELKKQKENKLDSNDEEEINKKIQELFSENKFFSPEGEKVWEAYQDFLIASVDSVRNLRMEFYRKELSEPSLNGLAEIYQQLKYKSGLETELLSLFENNYSDFMPDHPYSKFIKGLANEKAPVPGNKFIEIIAPDLQGNPTSISDVINGKIAVIDLWASWCGPCRIHSMDLIPIYEKYKDKGFEIIAIARESGNTEAMVKAIEKDGYPWLNLVDLNDNLGVWSKYRAGLSGGKIILVDENGIIVSIDPTAEEVETYLQTHL